MHRWNALSLRPPHATLPHIKHISFHYSTTGREEKRKERKKKKKRESRGAAVLKGHLICSGVALMYLITRPCADTFGFAYEECDSEGK